MNVYMLMAAAVLFLALLMRGDIPQNRRYIVWACILMFVVYGLRDAYSVGNDSASSYLHFFQNMENTSWVQLRAGADLNDNLFWTFSVKLGYVLLNGNYQLFIAIIAAFVTTVFGRFVYRYSTSPVQSFVYYWGLWFYTFNFSALKQSIAMSILLIAFDAVMDRRLVRFLLLVMLAALVHFPSVVFLPAYWIVKLNIRHSFMPVLVAAFAVVYFRRAQILNFMVQFYYEERVFEEADRFLTGKVVVMLLLLLAAFFLHPPGKGDMAYAASLQFVAVATVIQLFSVYNNVFERLADYYFQFAVIFVPFILDRRSGGIRTREQYAVITAAPYILGVLCLYRFNDMVNRTAAYLLPYRFFFQAEPVKDALAQVSLLLNTRWF